MTQKDRLPEEAPLDSFRLARLLRPRFPFRFSRHGWTDRGGETIPTELVRAIVAMQLKLAFDKDQLLAADRKVFRVTAELTESVAVALAALMVSQ